MRGRGGFTVLIVGGGGSQVRRLSLPASLVYGGMAATLLLVSVVATIYGDYFSLKRRQQAVDALEGQAAEQRALLDVFERRMAEVQREVGSWQTVHGRLWEPFGPEPGRARGVGIGGGGGLLPVVFAEDALELSQQLEQLASTVSERGQSLRALERLVTRARGVLLALPSRWPVRGSINSPFGQRLSPWTGTPEFHRGLDIKADRNTPVLAPAAGTVIFAGMHGEYGNTLILDHGQDLRSLYGHLQEIKAAQGQRVKRGQLIALTGNTGKSSGPHLHYEVMVRGQAVDPRNFLWE